MKRSRKHLETVVAAVMAAALSGCSCGDTLDVDNVSPEGTVGGIIVDAVSRAGLADASVTLMAGGEIFDAVLTSATGAFSFENVPAGDVLITVAPPEGTSYSGTWIRAELSNAAGEFPTGNATLVVGPIGLVALDQSFSVRVLDEHGKPVSQYALALEHFVEYIDFSTGVPTQMGSVLVQATTDTGGYATFTRLPNFFTLSGTVLDTVVVYLPPLDVDANGIFEYAGGDRLFELRALANPTPDIVLDSGYDTNLYVRNSTIAQLAGTGGTAPTPAVIAINDVIHVAFNLPIQNNVEIVVSDEFGVPITQTPSLSITGDNLAINFGGDPLLPGNEYNIHIHAVAAIGERLVTGDFTAAFFTPGISTDITVATIVRDPVSPFRVDIEFSEPIGNGSAAGLTLSGGNCVMFFNANLADTAQINYVGDVPGELTNPSCNRGGLNFIMNEPDPIGPAGHSGYTKYWTFNAPVDITTTFPVTGVHLFFSYIVTPTSIVERTNGTRVEDFSGSSSITIP